MTGTMIDKVAAQPQTAGDAAAVSVDAVSKSFTGRLAVDHLSFHVEPGETFGLVGPNGSGKTTTIRMILDILRPDAGRIRVLGQPPSNATKDRIGYLPEERGLYRGLSVERTLRYLGALKGMRRADTERHVDALLHRVGLDAQRRRRVGELSRGMSQLIGFCAAILHRPQLLILDEPFSGLDPLNVKMMKGLIVDLAHEGTTIIFSTHQMEDVEELCERVLMMYRGSSVLYGRIQEIKARFRSNTIVVDFEGRLPLPRGVARRVERGPASVELHLEPDRDPQSVLRELVRDGASIQRFEIATPSLNEIFIRVAESGRRG